MEGDLTPLLLAPLAKSFPSAETTRRCGTPLDGYKRPLTARMAGSCARLDGRNEESSQARLMSRSCPGSCSTVHSRNQAPPIGKFSFESLPEMGARSVFGSHRYPACATAANADALSGPSIIIESNRMSSALYPQRIKLSTDRCLTLNKPNLRICDPIDPRC